MPPCVNSWANWPSMEWWAACMTQLFASSLPGPNLASWAKLCFLGQNCCSMGKTGISRGSFPGQIRDPLIRSGNHSNRFRYRIRRIFPDFFPNPFFPEKMISGREFRYSVSVGTNFLWFLPEFVFSRENDTRSGITVFSVGRYEFFWISSWIRFFPRKWYSVGNFGIRCRSVREYPVPAFIPTWIIPTVNLQRAPANLQWPPARVLLPFSSALSGAHLSWNLCLLLSWLHLYDVLSFLLA